jgi:hypothetical protein
VKAIGVPLHLKFNAEKSAFLIDEHHGGYRLELQPINKMYGKAGVSDSAVERISKFEQV